MNRISARDGGTHPLLARRWAAAPADAPPLAGLFLLWAEPGIAELAALLDVDFLVIDMEAGALGRPEVLRLVQVLSGWPVTVLVRVPSHEQHIIEHALDIGAHGVMVPKVNSAAEAEAVVAATRFPPEGRRGVNPVRAAAYFGDLPAYFHRANHEVLCVVQIETGEAVAEVDKIASVAGVDAVFLGMGDLAMALGQPGDVSGADMDRARAAVLDAGRRHGKLAGAFAYGIDVARAYAAEGFDFMAVSNDVKLLREGITRVLELLHESASRWPGRALQPAGETADHGQPHAQPPRGGPGRGGDPGQRHVAGEPAGVGLLAETDALLEQQPVAGQLEAQRAAHREVVRERRL